MNEPSLSDSESLQVAIDALDRQILELLSQRRQLVHQQCEIDGQGLVGRVARASARIDAVVAGMTGADPAIPVR